MANKIEFKILADTKTLEKTLGSASKKFTKLGKTLSVSLTLPIALLGAGMIKLASDAEETANKFDVVFRSIRDDARDWASDFSDSVGRSNEEIQRFSSGLGDVLKPLGFATDEAFELSKNMTKLALDVASFNNRQDADVIRAFTSALTGERESLKTLGIVINEVDVKQEAYTLGLVKQGEALSKTAKAQATISLLYKNTEDAQGDLLRTQDSFANQMKRLRGETENLGVAFGEVLLPSATALVKSLGETAKEMGKLDTSTIKFIITIGGILALMGPLLLLIGGVGLGFSALASAVTFSSGAIIILGGSIFTLTTALVALGGVGAAAFAGWKIGQVIDEIIQLNKVVNKLDRSLKEQAATQERSLAARGLTTQDVTAFAAKNAARVRQEALDAEIEQQVDHNAKILALDDALRIQTKELKEQEKQDLDELEDAKLETELITRDAKFQSFLADLILRREALENNGALTVEIEDKIAKQILKIKKLQSKNEGQILKEKFGLEAKLRARDVDNIDKTFSDIASLSKTAAQVIKAIDLGLSIISISKGVSKALGEGNFVKAALIAAQGAIEIATIATQSFAHGTDEIPRDQIAEVHRGETIIPKTFADAIRSNDLSLSGPSGEGGGGSGPVFDFTGATFNGVTEEFVEDIFTKASENIANNTLAFAG